MNKKTIKTSIKTTHLVFKNADKNGLSKIYIELALNGRQKRFPTNVKISREFCPNKKCIKAIDLKKVLSTIEYQNVYEVEARVDRIITTWSIAFPNRPISIAAIESELYGVSQKEKQDQDIFFYYEEFLKQKSAGNHNSYLTHSRTRDLFKEFTNSIKKVKQVKVFEDITVSVLDQFRIFLDGTKSFKNPDGMQLQTVNTRMEKLRDFIKYYFKDKKHTNTIFVDYKFKKTVREEDKFIVTLTKDELKAFEDFDFRNNKRLERVRDLFILQSRFGMRYEELIELNPNRYKQQADGKITIDFVLKKTKKKVFYTLPEKAVPYFNKLVVNSQSGTIKKITNGKYNDYLKEALAFVAEKCTTLLEPITKSKFIGSKILDETRVKYEWICTHSARRTFINLALECGVPPKSIIKFTGHSSLEILNVYINRHQGEDEALKKLDF
jgi:site-specific recombinase XerD